MIALITIVCCCVAFSIILLRDNGSERPSISRTLTGIGFAVIGLAFPVLFEDGCDTNRNPMPVLVTRSATGALTVHEYMAWCPTHCVHVPGQTSTWLTLPNGIAFQVVFSVKDPVKLVRALHWDATNIISADDVDAAVFRRLRPFVHGYLATHQEALLRRNLREQKDLNATFRELAEYLPQAKADGAPPSVTPTRFSDFGLELQDISDLQIAGN